MTTANVFFVIFLTVLTILVLVISAVVGYLAFRQYQRQEMKKRLLFTVQGSLATAYVLFYGVLFASMIQTGSSRDYIAMLNRLYKDEPESPEDQA